MPEFFRQVEAEVVSNSRKNNHQTWGLLFSPNPVEERQMNSSGRLFSHWGAVTARLHQRRQREKEERRRERELFGLFEIHPLSIKSSLEPFSTRLQRNKMRKISFCMKCIILSTIPTLFLYLMDEAALWHQRPKFPFICCRPQAPSSPPSARIAILALHLFLSVAPHAAAHKLFWLLCNSGVVLYL